MSKNTNMVEVSLSSNFGEAASFILWEKYRTVKKRIRRFLDKSTVKNLHSLRISIRRLRYSVENFEVCFAEEDYRWLINCTKSLQDLIGEGRDIDMLMEKVNYIAAEAGASIPASFYTNLEAKRDELIFSIKLALMKFVLDKNVQRLLTKLKEE
ncbi:MAG: CHAD domain-containing protein [Ignavibacteriales bacterium]